LNRAKNKEAVQVVDPPDQGSWVGIVTRGTDWLAPTASQFPHKSLDLEIHNEKHFKKSHKEESLTKWKF
jgi:hypothetical protein